MSRRPPRFTPSRSSGRPESSSRLALTLYGDHAVHAALLNPDRTIHAVWATPEQQDDVQEWLAQAQKQGLKRPTLKIVPRSAFDQALAGPAVHQGVGIKADPLPDATAEDLIRRVEHRGDRGVIVMLDQVTDPHNMGAIIRSACAFGAAGMIVQRRHAPDLNAVIAKAACGAMEHLPVAYETNLARTIEHVKEAGFTAIALDERGAQTLAEWQPGAKTLLVLGAEGAGLRRLVQESCDITLRLPTGGPVPSLNVSNAAAVALYRLRVG